MRFERDSDNSALDNFNRKPTPLHIFHSAGGSASSLDCKMPGVKYTSRSTKHFILNLLFNMHPSQQQGLRSLLPPSIRLVKPAAFQHCRFAPLMRMRELWFKISNSRESDTFVNLQPTTPTGSNSAVPLVLLDSQALFTLSHL